MRRDATPRRGERIHDNSKPLPEEPIDRLVVTLWRVITGNMNGVYPERFVYHIHTKWNDFAPDDPGGVDIKASWMCYEFGTCRGRMPDWESLGRILEYARSGEFPPSHERYYLTRADAARVFKERAEHTLDRLTAEIKAVSRALSRTAGGYDAE